VAYSPYTVRVITRAIITKTNAGQGTPQQLSTAYPTDAQAAILAEVYRLRPDLKSGE